MELLRVQESGSMPQARNTAWMRSVTWSLSRIRDTWFCTVFSETLELPGDLPVVGSFGEVLEDLSLSGREFLARRDDRAGGGRITARLYGSHGRAGD